MKKTFRKKMLLGLVIGVVVLSFEGLALACQNCQAGGDPNHCEDQRGYPSQSDSYQVQADAELGPNGEKKHDSDELRPQHHANTNSAANEGLFDFNSVQNPDLQGDSNTRQNFHQVNHQE